MLALSVSVTKRQKLRKIKRLIQTIENVSHAACRCRTNKSPREGAFVRWRGRRDDRSADLVVVHLHNNGFIVLFFITIFFMKKFFTPTFTHRHAALR